MRTVTTQPSQGPVLYWKHVSGQVVLGVCLLCVVLLLLQHVALKQKSKENE